MAKKTRRTQVTVSRLKSFLSFSDSFGSGFASGWKTVRGTWSASSGSATTSDTSYPIQTVQMSNANVTINLENPGVGTGTALWVSDSGTWWSVVSKQETCSGCGACSSYNPYNPCGATNPYNSCCSTNPYNPCSSTNPYNSCCSGGYNYNVFNSCGYYNPFVSGTNPSNYTCSMYNPGGYCKYGYTTPGNYYAYGGNCAATVNSVYVPCSGCGGNCIGSGGNCNGCGGNCIGTGGDCASYANTYPRYLKLYKYASSTLTELASVTLDSVTSFAPIKAIKVAITNSNKANGTATVTAKAFSDTSAVTQIGTDLVHNATGVTIVTNYGIIASDSAYNQSLSTDGITIQ